MIAHMVWWLALAFVTALVAGVTAKLPVPAGPPAADGPGGDDTPALPLKYIPNARRSDRPKLPQEIVDALAAVKYGSRSMPVNAEGRTQPAGADLVSRERQWTRALHAQPPFEIL